MRYYVDCRAPAGGCGTKDHPFKTIQPAAELAQPGDEVIVAPGIYRERVDPKHAGTKEAPIVYRSLIPLSAEITGAEEVKNWTPYQGDVWSVRIGNGGFGSRNPYTTELFGDWYDGFVVRHTGEVYLNGRSMYERPTLEEVLNPTTDRKSWEPEFTLHTWYTCQENGETVIYANFQGSDPNREIVEINVRSACFYPERTGVNYITVSGFKISKAATQWAPPTAYQEGMIGPHWSKGWVIEDCEICDSKCCGISLGKYLQPDNDNKWSRKFTKHGTQTERTVIMQALYEGWTKENIGSHVIRRCNIHHCEQCGIVGHLGGVFSVIEDNHIHHINNKQQLSGAEIGGIKMHAAIDVIIRRNHIHHCTRGIWLDWQAQGTRVTQCFFHHNMTPPDAELGFTLGYGEDLFVEVSHGPTLIDNNVMLSDFSVRLCSQGAAFVHNLIAGPLMSIGIGSTNPGTAEPRYTPVHFPHRTEVFDFMTIVHGDDRFFSNIFLQGKIDDRYNEAFQRNFHMPIETVSGLNGFDEYPTPEEYNAMFTRHYEPSNMAANLRYYAKLPIYTGGNVYFNGAKPWKHEQNFCETEAPVYARVTEEDGEYGFETNVTEYLPKLNTGLISTETLGEAFEPEQRYENPDGTPILFNEDYYGNHRGLNPLPGPFAE